MVFSGFISIHQFSAVFSSFFFLGLSFQVKAQPADNVGGSGPTIGSPNSGCLVQCADLNNYCERSGCGNNMGYVPVIYFPEAAEGEAKCGEYICGADETIDGSVVPTDFFKYPFHGATYVKKASDPNAKHIYTTAPRPPEDGGELILKVSDMEAAGWKGDDSISIMKVSSDESFSTVCSCYLQNIEDGVSYTTTDATVTEYSLRLRLNMGPFPEGEVCQFCKEKQWPKHLRSSTRFAYDTGKMG